MFINLHVYSEYSFDYGFIKINEYVKYVYEKNLDSIVITEHLNLYSSIKFYNESLKYGIKPIIGCEVFVEDIQFIYTKVIFLCKDFNGYKNLIKLLSKSYIENMVMGIPIIKKKWLLNLSSGLIAIGSSYESDIGFSLIKNKFNYAKNALDFWNFTFPGRFYLSLTKLGFDKELIFMDKLFYFIKTNCVLLIITNKVLFLKKNDYALYKSKIASGRSKQNLNINKFNKNNYFKSYEDISYLFNDVSSAIENSFEISKRCNILFSSEGKYIPKFRSKSFYNSKSYLHKISLIGLFYRLNKKNKINWKIYILRLKSELNIIELTKFVDYFLITYGFVNWAKKKSILIGPGRGSGGGSLVAYSLFITDIDPIKYDLLFERFLNTERVSNPDFDIDFCVEGRDFIIDYIFNEYTHVAQIATFGSMNAKAAIRDVGRGLGYPYSFVDKIAKILSIDTGITLKNEIKNNYNLRYEYCNSYEVRSIVKLALKLEGLVKNVGMHAGGLVISSNDLSNHMSLFRTEDHGNIVTQLDKNDLEFLGLIKFDFLGLKTLTIINTVTDFINTYNILYNFSIFNINSIPLNNPFAFSLLYNADTSGIFQLESRGIKNVIKKLKPDSFEDIIALVALYRPGPLQSGMLNDFIDRKFGRKIITYLHKNLESILKETYGVIIYQEQVMHIARKLSNYSMGSADLLRSAMSKKKKSDMSNHLKKFVNGAKQNKIDEKISTKIFNLIEKFAGYGFNKSHSVGYALLTYYTSWFKANYNIIFMNCLLSSDMYNIDKLNMFINDCKTFNIKIVIPDINYSFYCFTILNDKSVLFGFGAIKGMGESLVSDILVNRSRYGLFKNFFDFYNRMYLCKINKTLTLLLINSGVFDKFSESQSTLSFFVSNLSNFSEKLIYDKFDNLYIYTFSNKIFNYQYKYTVRRKFYLNNLDKEKNLLSLCLTNISSNICYFIIKNIGTYENLNINNFELINKTIISGFIYNLRYISVKNLNYLIIGLKFNKNIINILLSETLYIKYKKIIKYEKFLFCFCEFIGNKLYVIDLNEFDYFISNFIKYFELILDNIFISYKNLKILFNLFYKNLGKNGSNIILKYEINGLFKFININKKITINLSDKLINELSDLNFIVKIRFIY